MPFDLSAAREPALRQVSEGSWPTRLFVAPTRGEIAAVCALATLGLLGVWALVTQTGLYVYVHLAYLPIAAVALFAGAPGGAAAGLAAGLAVGPLTPHVPILPDAVSQGLTSDNMGWVFRTLAFVVFGAVTGFVLVRIRRLTARAIHRTHVDEVTGHPNQAYLHRVLAMMAAGGGSGTLYAINFTGYRDVLAAFGTGTADAAWRTAARVLHDNLPHDAVMFALHPPYLAVLVPAENAERIEHQVLRALRAPIDAGRVPLSLEPTLGLTHVDLNGAQGPAVVHNAIAASEQAMESGIDRLAYEHGSEAQRQANVRVLAAFHRALEAKDQLRMVYQPKLCLADGAIIGCEALIRWQDPAGDPMPPDRFIPVVERSSLIRDLTEFTFATALRQAAAWRADGLALPLAVNLSARLLAREDLVAWLQAHTERAGLPNDALQIEITETAALYKGSTVLQNLAELRDVGIAIAIDDYGTGLSSLQYLREIPATTVKIDKTFIQQITTQPEDRALVRSTIELARELGLETVAEGVEDENTAETLRELGCDSAQGYHYAAPLAYESFCDFGHARAQ